MFWVHADSEMTFTRDYRLIAKKLGVASHLDGDELLAGVREKIDSGGRYVLVLDNVDDLSLFGVGHNGPSSAAAAAHAADQTGGQTAGQARDLRGFVPCGPSGTVLWTSRDKRIGGTLVAAGQAVGVGRMTADEARTLLGRVRYDTVGDEESSDVDDLLAELDWLALAVSQAAAYLRRTSTPVKDYMAKLKRGKGRWKLLQKTEFDRHRRPEVSNSILETWNISLEHIRGENMLAYNVLLTLGFVDFRDIPDDILRKAAEYGRGRQEGDSISSNSSDSESSKEDEVTEACTRLREFSFISKVVRGDSSSAYEMHKLVQEALRYNLSRKGKQAEQAYFSRTAYQIVFDLFPQRRRGKAVWEQSERYLAHAQQVSKWAELWQGEEEVSALLSQVSNYLFDRGRWREKEPIDSRAYELRRKTLGDKHPDTIRSMAELAVTYHAPGEV